MSKRVLPAVVAVLGICAQIGLASFALAQDEGREGRGSFPVRNPSRFDRPVGTCATVEGCEALKTACAGLEGHVFEASNEPANEGICRKERADVSEAKCFSIPLCNQLALTCKGSFERYLPGIGVCRLDGPS
ncbi:MAG: hypothetical protein ACFB6R_07195 [Alphaproteobacteria bacterium]